MVLTLPRDIAEEKVSHATEANRPITKEIKVVKKHME